MRAHRIGFSLLMAFFFSAIAPTSAQDFWCPPFCICPDCYGASVGHWVIGDRQTVGYVVPTTRYLITGITVDMAPIEPSLDAPEIARRFTAIGLYIENDLELTITFFEDEVRGIVAVQARSLWDARVPPSVVYGIRNLTADGWIRETGERFQEDLQTPMPPDPPRLTFPPWYVSHRPSVP